jgi:hypothetical protein
MENEKEITQFDFEKELKTMAVSCIGVKEATAKKKASDIYKKYSGIISYTEEHKDEYKELYYKTKKMFDALKSGSVPYRAIASYSSGDKIQGVLLIENIMQVEVRKEDVLIVMKNGKEIIMSSDFAFLKEIF